MAMRETPAAMMKMTNSISLVLAGTKWEVVAVVLALLLPKGQEGPPMMTIHSNATCAMMVVTPQEKMP